jgi:hypothetical protein
MTIQDAIVLSVIDSTNTQLKENLEKSAENFLLSEEYCFDRPLLDISKEITVIQGYYLLEHNVDFQDIRKIKQQGKSITKTKNFESSLLRRYATATMVLPDNTLKYISLIESEHNIDSKVFSTISCP